MGALFSDCCASDEAKKVRDCMPPQNIINHNNLSEIFKVHHNKCKKTDFSKCESMHRITIIIDKFNHLMSTPQNTQSQQQFLELINNIFIKNNYNNTQSQQ
eukprot:63709_1